MTGKIRKNDTLDDALAKIIVDSVLHTAVKNQETMDIMVKLSIGFAVLVVANMVGMVGLVYYGLVP